MTKTPTTFVDLGSSDHTTVPAGFDVPAGSLIYFIVVQVDNDKIPQDASFPIPSEGYGVIPLEIPGSDFDEIGFSQMTREYDEGYTEIAVPFVCPADFDHSLITKEFFEQIAPDYSYARSIEWKSFGSILARN